jgi:hypothetical protein
MPGDGCGALAEEVLPQILLATRTPLDPLWCHARRARGTASLPDPAAGRRAPPPGHPGPQQEAHLPTRPSTCCPQAPGLDEALERALADGGYEGAGIGICVPVKNPPGNQRPDPDTKTRNSLLRGLRSQGERGFALLTQRWTALQRITASPRRTTQVVQAALVLTQFEHKYIN